MKNILNVAEKPSVAKQISKVLSNFQYKNSQSLSKYNPIHTFDYQLPQNDQLLEILKINNNNLNQNMIFTSVTGHNFSYKFIDNNWLNVDPQALFKTQQIQKFSTDNKQGIIQNLQEQAKLADLLILWLDCDLEGENIAFEVMDIVQKQNPDIHILRAHFSSLERSQILKALQNLRKPNENMNKAVDARQELDLRIGSAFTRFQTMLLRNKLQNNQLLSYGLCQFPTLGFITDRFIEYQNFEKKDFWKIKCCVNIQDEKILEDNCKIKKSKSKIQEQEKTKKEQQQIQKQFCFEQVLEEFLDQKQAQKVFNESKKGKNIEGIVKNVEQKQVAKLRPLPMNTLQLQQIGTQYLKISSSSLMEKAEKLYQKGYISYPRTETNQFPSSINDNLIQTLIKKQITNEDWGEYAKKMELVKKDDQDTEIENEEKSIYLYPRKGQQNDQAHPPIYPIRGIQNRESLQSEGLDYNVYELITRHFLAVCSQNAQVQETSINIKINKKLEFKGNFKEITEKGFLEVYEKFDSTQFKSIPQEFLKVGYKFVPDVYKLEKGQTQPEPLLSERDLLTLMDKHRIGTDATMHDHIQKIVDRQYVYKKGQVFVPNKLGISLVETYKQMGFNLHDAQFRSIMEQRIQNIVNGKEEKEIVVDDILDQMEKTFESIAVRKEEFYEIASSYLDYNGNKNNKIEKKQGLEKEQQKFQYGRCGKCQGELKLVQNSKKQIISNYFEKEGKLNKYLECNSCKTIINVPQQGDLKLYKQGVTCEYCNYPVLSNTKKPKQNVKIEYKFCPVCFYKPPIEFEQKQQNYNYMQCSECPSQTCQVKNLYTKEQKIYQCPSCIEGEVFVKIKNNYNIIECNKQCGYTANLPKIIQKVDSLQKDNFCKKCSKEGRGDNIQKVRLFVKGNKKFSKYMTTKLDKENSGIFCINPGCSEDLLLVDYIKTGQDWEQKQQLQQELENKKQIIIEKFNNKSKKQKQKKTVK